MSSYERTAIQAVIGQKVDGQFHQVLLEHEGPVRLKQSVLKQKCIETESLKPDLVSLPSASHRHSDDLEYVYGYAEHDIAERVQAHEEAEKTLRAAKLQHGYTGTSDDKSKVQTYLTLGIFVFVEAFINAAFFNNASMVSGPTAAMLTSFLISLTNVTASACAGYFIGRYLNYGLNALDEDGHFKRKRHKAKLQFLGFVAVLVFFHTTVGLVRAQESIEAVIHSPAAYLHMLQSPEAIFLILMGSCMSVIAYHKGVYSLDCPYPEIGRLQRRVEETDNKVEEAVEYYQCEIIAYFDETEKDADASLNKEKKAVEKYNKSVSSCHKARRELEQTVSESESLCRGKLAELITSYGCISGGAQEVPVAQLQQMVSFEKYLDIEIPAYQAPPEPGSYKAELLAEKNRAMNRLVQIYQRLTHPNGEES